MSKKLYVGNLSFQSTSEDLQSLFAAHGNVESATVIQDKLTNRSRGFGFVEMSTVEEANEAREKLNGSDFQGRNLKIDLANERTSSGPRSGGSSNYRSGGSDSNYNR
jgi:RNA recognition motif-containing protein